MRRYNPTTEEIDALFIVAPFLNDAIDINNDHFYDEETTDLQRNLIYKESKKIYKSILKIYISNSNLPFG
jgi:hypothetical protein